MKLTVTPRPISPEIESESASQSTPVFNIHAEGTAFGLLVQTARYGSSSEAVEAADFVVDRMGASLQRLAES
jgi:hypothetical protein